MTCYAKTYSRHKFGRHHTLCNIRMTSKKSTQIIKISLLLSRSKFTDYHRVKTRLNLGFINETLSKFRQRCNLKVRKLCKDLSFDCLSSLKLKKYVNINCSFIVWTSEYFICMTFVANKFDFCTFGRVIESV